MSRRLLCILLGMACVNGVLLRAAHGQEVRGSASPVPAAATTGATEVVIERMAVKLRDPAGYQTPLVLSAVKSLTVRARVDGIIASVLIKPGDKVQKQTELVRLDSTERQKLFLQAQTDYKLAQLQETTATGDGKEAASLRATSAKVALEIAQLRLDDMVQRSPIEAQVQRVHVTEGEFVLAGDPLVDVADPAQLTVEIPVDRRLVKPDETIKLIVEDQTVDARLSIVLPAPAEFSPLRDLFVSVASGSALVDNSAGKLAIGQSVTSTMIPRHPIAEVQNSALVNADGGARKVQVIRDGFVRDVPVELLGAVGELHSFVSGRFTEGDEVVVRSSTTLVDGAWVRPKLDALKSATSAPAPSSSPANPTQNTPTRQSAF